MEQALTDDLPPAQRLALAYAPRRSRPPTLALLALDAKLAGMLRRRGEPVLVQMRLAWWRDTLPKPVADWPKGDPVLDLLRTWADPAGLVPLVDGWEALLRDRLDGAAIDEFAGGRAAAFALLARELCVDARPAAGCGRLWALGDLAANVGDPEERSVVVEKGRALSAPASLPRSLRPLAILAELAKRSLARGGTPLLDGPRAALVAIRLGIAGR